MIEPKICHSSNDEEGNIIIYCDGDKSIKISMLSAIYLISRLAMSIAAAKNFLDKRKAEI